MYATSLDEDLMELSGVNDRDLVKSFVTVAMGAFSKQKAQSSWYLSGRGTENFVAIEEAVAKRYPALKLFDDWGINAHCTSSAHLAPLALQSKRHFLLMVTPV
jgi:hypothetical protein